MLYLGNIFFFLIVMLDAYFVLFLVFFCFLMREKKDVEFAIANPLAVHRYKLILFKAGERGP